MILNYKEQIYLNRQLEPNSLDIKRNRFHWKELKDKALDFFKDIVTTQYTFGVLFDPDVDGFGAGHLMKHYLETKGFHVKAHMNKDKVHGLQEEAMDWISKENINYVLVVDAGSGDSDSIKELINKNIKVLVLDHHDYQKDYTLPKDIIFNAQDHDPIKDLSGCGVVYYFLEELSLLFGDRVKQYEKIVGMTILSDVCSMLPSENRYFVYQTYESIKNKDFILFNHFPFYGSYHSHIAFTVVPFLNAMIRCNYTNEILSLSNKLYHYEATEILTAFHNIKEVQKAKVEELLLCGKTIELYGLVIFVRPLGDAHLKTFNGLIANKLKTTYQTNAMALEYNSDLGLLQGSYRGEDLDHTSFKKYGIEGKGHLRACGVSFTVDILKELVDDFNHQTKIDTRSDLTVNSSFFAQEDYLWMAWFNEYTGKEMTPITLQIKNEPLRQEKLNKRIVYYYPEFQVIEFENRKINKDKIIVEPKLSRYGFQMIRG